MSKPITLRRVRTKDEERAVAELSSEHAEQVLLFRWAGLAAGRRPALRTLFAIPNGGQRNIVTAVKLKREGVKAGVPDVCLPVARGPYHALYVEMKYDKNKPSPSQIEWHDWLRQEGNAVRVCWSWEAARDAIELYLDFGSVAA